MNREEWLTELGLMIQPLFRGFSLPPWQATCGWPSVNAIGGKALRVGECHGPGEGEDGRYQIFISPLVDKVEQVSGVLAHELTHVAAGLKAGHGKKFVRVAHLIGLTEGRPTSATAGPELKERLIRMAERLGPYPHRAIVPTRKIVTKAKGTIRVECPCGCKFGMPMKWFMKVGAPTCGCGQKMALAPTDDPPDGGS